MRKGSVFLAPRPTVWLDMDPGIDDSWAIAVALSRCSVQGISTVAGNVALEHTFQNTHDVLQVLNHSEIPVFPGADGPLLEPLITAKAFHGEQGLGDYVADASHIPAILADTPRVWSRWAQHSTGVSDTHLIATGPLTNLAIGFLAFPELRSAWKSITAMCGALPGTEMDKAKEFNVYVDPHAADVVFRYGARVQMLGINVAHKALVPIRDLSLLPQYGKTGRMLAKMLNFYTIEARGEGGNPDAFPIDDVVAVAAVSYPEIFQWRELPLTVVREGPLRGTVVISPIDVQRPAVKVALDIEVPEFLAWLWESMETYRA